MIKELLDKIRNIFRIENMRNLVLNKDAIA